MSEYPGLSGCRKFAQFDLLRELGVGISGCMSGEPILTLRSTHGILPIVNVFELCRTHWLTGDITVRSLRDEQIEVEEATHSWTGSSVA